MKTCVARQHEGHGEQPEEAQHTHCIYRIIKCCTVMVRHLKKFMPFFNNIKYYSSISSKSYKFKCIRTV